MNNASSAESNFLPEKPTAKSVKKLADKSEFSTMCISKVKPLEFLPNFTAIEIIVSIFNIIKRNSPL